MLHTSPRNREYPSPRNREYPCFVLTPLRQQDGLKKLMLEDFKMRATTLVIAAAVATATALPAFAENMSFMSLDEISRTIIGNSMTGESHAAGRYTEHYVADGTIRGTSEKHGRYQGRWWLREEDQLMCFKYGGGAFEAGCVRLALTGDRVDFVLLDGTVEPPARLIKGNPENL
jgi:hypothetical protein